MTIAELKVELAKFNDSDEVVFTRVVDLDTFENEKLWLTPAGMTCLIVRKAYE